MTRVTTMALAAAAMSLSTGTVAHAEMVEFNYIWYGYAPATPELNSWAMSHITDVSVAPNGDFSGPTAPTLNLYLDIGGELSPVEISDMPVMSLLGTANLFEMTMDLVDVPGYGAMHIEIGGYGVYHWEPHGLHSWSGEVQITWGPGLPFGETVTQSGEWSAQIVPAPGAIALFGLAGLSGRRRRD